MKYSKRHNSRQGISNVSPKKGNYEAKVHGSLTVDDDEGVISIKSVAVASLPIIKSRFFFQGSKLMSDNRSRF